MGIVKHGHSYTGKVTREYASWGQMKVRCLDPNHHKYPRYGGRGIKVCERWLEFENFLADMGPRPPGTTLDRKENDGDYEPSNCRWGTPVQQASNRSCTIYATLDGRTQHVAAWCRELGLKEATICMRVKRGATLIDALTKPLADRGQDRKEF